MQRWPGSRCGVLTCTLLLSLFGVTPAYAQCNTQHIKGLVGLKGGSLPPPHIYVIAPLVYVYKTDTVRDRNGNRVPIDASITTVAGATGISVVTSKKLFGGDY